MRINGLLLVASLAGMMTGCGQKGPLVLPDKQRPHKKIVLPQPRTPSAAQPPTQGEGPTQGEAPTQGPAPGPAQPPAAPAPPSAAAPASQGAPAPQP